MHQQIKSSLKEAMIAKDQVKLSVIRGLLSSFTNELVSKGNHIDMSAGYGFCAALVSVFLSFLLC